MNIDLSQFVGVFFEETDEHLAEMEHLLLAIDNRAADPDQLNSIFRAAHSIKGSAGVFGFQALTSVTHVLENLLDRLRNGTMSLQPGMIDAFLAAADTLKAIAAAYKQGNEPDMASANRMCERLEAFSQGAPTAATETAYGLFAEPAAPETAYGFFADDVNAAPAPSTTAPVDEAFGFFTEPAPTGSVPPDAGYGFFAPEPAKDPVAQYVETVMNPAAALATAPSATAPTADATHMTRSNTAPQPSSETGSASSAARNTAPPTVAASAKKLDAGESTSIRVNTEKIDQIINLVGELVITQSMLAQTASELVSGSHERLNERMKTLERNTRDLQEAVMSIRMMPVSFIFNRFPRVVRDLAQKLNKQVELIIEGENTELDKGLIEKLADPLTHLVRNSIDHGIELPAHRRDLGKPEQGTIRLTAYQRSGSIVIEVIDDGGGLRRDKILAKARERNLPVSDDMPDSEVWQLIFAPGFSTAEQVTDVSGRGVGMDVVKRNIQEIGGRIDIQSIAGIGSTISIRLPLTLAILDGMVVAVGSERYVIPLVFISESLQPTADDIRSLTGSGQVIRVRDDYIPLSALYQHMGITPLVTDPTKGLLVVLECEGKKLALLVDELLGQQQVVIKSLESNYRRVDGVAGATIMGDGRVALILNIEALIQRYSKLPPITAAALLNNQRGAA